jgi:threonylcarbamoyladenosine tRNA methylthiotransferase MtaB
MPGLLACKHHHVKSDAGMMDGKPKKKALVRVLGCKVNQAEAAAMAGILEDTGYQVDETADNPDLVLVNTCCVTSKAEGKSRRMVKRLKDRYPSARLVVTGCLAEIHPDSISAISEESIVLGAANKARFLEHVESGFGGGAPLRDAPDCGAFADLGFRKIPRRSRNFLKIQDGCAQCCSYCIVPIARGPSRSLAPDLVVAHAKSMAAQGVAEIVLTGIHLGSYGRDLRPMMRLEKLLRLLVNEVPLVRFRLSSIEPQELTSGIIDLAAKNSAMCRHFHIPLQSGDDTILAVMGRPYRTRFIRNLTARIYSAIPDACIGFDVMVGFPGENRDSFARTLDLIHELAPAYLHVFPFSPRPGTRAASFKPRVDAETAANRVETLRALSRDLRRNFYLRFLGRTFTAVSESELGGKSRTVTLRTDNYIPVRVSIPTSLPPRRTFMVIPETISGEDVIGRLSDGE